MLRVSANTQNRDLDIALVLGDEGADEAGIEHGRALMKFAEALASRDQEHLAQARQQLLDNAGPAALVDAAGVAANFQRMVRIADATGIPVDSFKHEVSNQVRDELNLYAFASARNSIAEPV